MYTFRVKPDTGLEKLLDYLSALDTTPTVDELRDFGWPKSDVRALRRMALYCDNFSLTSKGVTYTDVVPQTVIQHAETVDAKIAATQATGPTDHAPVIRWPGVPMVADRMENFCKPSWYPRMKMMVEAGRHIMLKGPPGIGKSTAIEQLAAECGKPLVNVASDAGLRRRDLVGHQLVNGANFLAAEYVAAAVNGWWAKVDDANAAEPDALMYLNHQLAPPFQVSYYGKSAPVHPDFRLFITYNPGLVGTKPLPPALQDRFFPVKLEFSNAQRLRTLLEANGMPKRDDNLASAVGDWTDLIVNYGVACWEQHVKGRCRYQITPRRLMDATTLIKSGENPKDALEASVVDMVDNLAEARVLKETLKTAYDAWNFGRS